MFRSKKLSSVEISKNVSSDTFIFSYYYQFGELPSTKKTSITIYDVLNFDNSFFFRCNYVSDYLNREIGSDSAKLFKALRDSDPIDKKAYVPSSVAMNILFHCVTTKQPYTVFRDAFILAMEKIYGHMHLLINPEHLSCTLYCSVNYFYRNETAWKNLPLVNHTTTSILKIGDHLKVCSAGSSNPPYNKKMIKSNELYTKPIEIENETLDVIFDPLSSETGIYEEASFTMIRNISDALADGNPAGFFIIVDTNKEIKTMFCNLFLEKANYFLGPDKIIISDYEKTKSNFIVTHPSFINIHNLKNFSFSIPYYLVKNMDLILENFLNYLLVSVCFLEALSGVLNDADITYGEKKTFLDSIRALFLRTINSISDINIFYSTLCSQNEKIKAAYSKYAFFIHELITPKNSDSYEAISHSYGKNLRNLNKLGGELSLLRDISSGDQNCITFKSVKSLIGNLKKVSSCQN